MGEPTAEAWVVGTDDAEKRAFAWELLKASNDVVVGFAKLMSSMSLSAIGVLLALAGFAHLTPDDAGVWPFLLGLACGAYLVTALIFAYVVRGRQIDVSLDDYDDVIEQFLATARIRQRATTVGLVIVALATTTAISSVLLALHAGA